MWVATWSGWLQAYDLDTDIGRAEFDIAIKTYGMTPGDMWSDGETIRVTNRVDKIDAHRLPDTSDGSTTTPVVTDLGYLLHKHPDRVRSIDAGFGRAHVFYPEATTQRCTATTYVEVDPFGPARHRRERRAQGLEPYLNDRPYAASSMLSVALGRLFGTDAGSSTCDRSPRWSAVTQPRG